MKETTGLTVQLVFARVLIQVLLLRLATYIDIVTELALAPLVACSNLEVLA